MTNPALVLLLGPLLTPALQRTEPGSAAAPAVAFRGDADTGIYLADANTVGVAAGGSAVATFSAGQALIGASKGTTETPALAFLGDTTTGLRRVGDGVLGVVAAGQPVAQFGSTSFSVEGATQFTQPSATSGTPDAALTVMGGSHTGLAAAEAVDFELDLSRIVQFAAGAFALQRVVKISPPEYRGAGGGTTITEATTLYIEGAPNQGALATLTNPYALHVAAGDARFGGRILIPNTNNPAAPLLAFQGDAENGLYSPGANQVGIATAGAQVAAFTSSALRLVDGVAGSPAYSFLDDDDTGIWRIDADNLGITVGGGGGRTIDISTARVDFGSGGGMYLQVYEIADPGVAPGNGARLYARDNGGGKTQLVVIFQSGAVQVLATEP